MEKFHNYISEGEMPYKRNMFMSKTAGQHLNIHDWLDSCQSSSTKHKIKGYKLVVLSELLLRFA